MSCRCAAQTLCRSSARSPLLSNTDAPVLQSCSFCGTIVALHQVIVPPASLAQADACLPPACKAMLHVKSVASHSQLIHVPAARCCVLPVRKALPEPGHLQLHTHFAESMASGSHVCHVLLPSP